MELKKNNEVQDESLKKGKISVEDQVIRLFDDVIEADETIQKGFKPNKKKVFASFIIFDVIVAFFFSLTILGMWLDGEIPQKEKIIGTCIVAGVVLLIVSLTMWFVSLYYKNAYYVYTNKRIIVRTGVFGVDFHSLDIDNIGASNVCVSLLDKMVGKNTGSIRFGSNSSPITNSYYGFMNIENPYQVYKEIKGYIQTIQTSEKETETKK